MFRALMLPLLMVEGSIPCCRRKVAGMWDQASPVGPGRGVEPSVSLLEGAADIALILTGLSDHIVITLLEKVGMCIVHYVLEGLETAARRIRFVAVLVLGVRQGVVVFVTIAIERDGSCIGDGILRRNLGDACLNVIDAGERDRHRDGAVGILGMKDIRDASTPSALEGFVRE